MIVTVIMLVFVTIFLVTVAFVFIRNTTDKAGTGAESAASDQLTQIGTDFTVDAASSSKIYIRNTGTSPISSSSLAFYMDNVPISVSPSKATISPNEVGEFAITDKLEYGNLTLRVTGGIKEAKKMVSVPFITFAPSSDASGTYSRNFTLINISANGPVDTMWIEWNNAPVTIDSPGLALSMSLNNNTADSSRYGNNGTTGGTLQQLYADCSAATQGRFSGGCLFNGYIPTSILDSNANGSYIVVPNSQSLNISGNKITVEAWINPRNIDGSVGTLTGRGEMIISKGMTAITNGSYAIGIIGNSFTSGASTGFNRVGFITGSSASLIILSSSYSINAWHHIAATYDGTTKVIYVDGQFAGSEVVATDIPSSSSDLYIGASNILTAKTFFNGTIDEVRVWKRALSSQEIASSYKAEMGRYFINQTDLASGQYSYRVFANDTSGFSASTETRTFTFTPVTTTTSIPTTTTSGATTTTSTVTTTTSTTTCVTCFADNDNDGYGAGSALTCCGGVPSGSSTNSNDCYDSNANAKPGQTSYFTTHRGDGSFDYDCNSIDEKDPTLNCLGILDTTCIQSSTVTPGFDSIPACGVSGNWIDAVHKTDSNCHSFEQIFPRICGTISCPIGEWCATSGPWTGPTMSCR